MIGGGVIGVTTAAALASRGMQVTLLERAGAVGCGATARNGAQLSYSYADTLASPAVWRDLPTLVTGLDPAFRIHVSSLLRSLPWALAFLSNCRASRFTSNTRAVLRLALCSRSVLSELRARYLQLQFKHTGSGKLHLFASQEKLTAVKDTVRLKNELGCNQRLVTREEAVAIEPALATSPRWFIGAVYSPLDEAGDAGLFTRALADVAAKEHGLAVLTSTTVERFVLDRRCVRAVATSRGDIEAEYFVLTAGADCQQLAASASLSVPVHPMKGYSVTLPATHQAPRVSITDTRARIVMCRLENELRIAGIAELGRNDCDVDVQRVAALITAARSCLPTAADWSADPQPWSGLRPMTPDCRPIIGATRVGNLFLNCGHGMLGWTLACASAELLAATVLERNPTAHVRGMAQDFSIARFTGGGAAAALSCARS